MTGHAGLANERSTGWDFGQDVDLLVAFLNTRGFGAAADVLAYEETWHKWVVQRGLGSTGDRAQARRVRDALWASAAGETVIDGTGSLIRIELHHGTPLFAPADALGYALAAAARLVVTGCWERVKICPAEDCGRAIFDRSRNRSRMWCSMQVCGNREKARSWRERARAGAH